MRARRIPLRDRTWLRFRTVRAAGPLAVPSAGLVRQTLVGLADADPGHPLLCRLIPGRWGSRSRSGRLVPVPASQLLEHLERVVVEAPDAGDAEALARRLHEEPADDLTFRLVLGDGVAGARSAHVVGDGSVTDGWFVALLADAGDPQALVRRDRPAAPLTTALVRRFGRRPGDLPRALRAAVAAPPASPRAAATHSDPGPARPVHLGPPSTATTVVPQDDVDALRAVRDEHAPGTSVATLLMSGVAAALVRHGIEPHGAAVMASCRRELPPGSEVTGNFATGPWLDVDPADPVALGRAVRAATRDGVPLALLAAVTARSVLPRPAGPSTELVPVAARPRLTLSHQAQLPLPRLPWTDERSATYLLAAQPAGATGLTVAFLTTPAGVQVTAAGHAPVVDPAALKAALDDFGRSARMASWLPRSSAWNPAPSDAPAATSPSSGSAPGSWAPTGAR